MVFRIRNFWTICSFLQKPSRTYRYSGMYNMQIMLNIKIIGFTSSFCSKAYNKNREQILIFTKLSFLRKILYCTSICFQCDDVSLDLANGLPLQGVALLNIPYTHGGSNLWGDNLTGSKKKSKKKKRQKDLSTSSFNSIDLKGAVQGDFFLILNYFIYSIMEFVDFRYWRWFNRSYWSRELFTYGSSSYRFES